MGKHYLPKTMLICVIVFFMMPVWAGAPLDCNDSTRTNAADIKNKITIRAGQIGIAHAWTKFGEESSMPDIYLNGCALNIRDAGNFYVDIERVVSLANEDVIVLRRTAPSGACYYAYSLLAIKPDGSAREPYYFQECGDQLQLTDFKTNSDQLTFVDKSGYTPTIYRYEDGWISCEPCEPDTRSGYLDSLAGKLSIHRKSDELNKLLLNDREIGISGELIEFVDMIDQDHQPSPSPMLDGNQFVLIKKQQPLELGCQFKYILLTIKPDKSIQISDEFGNCDSYLNAFVDEQGLSIRFHSSSDDYPAQTVTVRSGKLSIEGKPVIAKPYKPQSFYSLQALYRDLADNLYKDVHNVSTENEEDIDAFAEIIEAIAQASIHTLADKRKILAIQLPSVNDFFENKSTCKAQFDCTTAFYFIDQDHYYLPVGMPLNSIGAIKADLTASPPRLSVMENDYSSRPPVQKALCYVLKSLAPGYPEEFFRTDGSLCLDMDTPQQPQVAEDKSCLSYDSPAKLVGTISRHTYPGLPNYESIEEGDEAETGLYLDLNEPVCTDESTDGVNEAKSGVKQIQLVVADKAMSERLNSLQGSVITVQGRLFSAITGHHHAPLLLEDLSL